MIQVLAHDLSVTLIYIFVRGRNYPLFFHVGIKCPVECSGDRNLNEGCTRRPLNGHHLCLTFVIWSITLRDVYTLGAEGLKWNFCVVLFWPQLTTDEELVYVDITEILANILLTSWHRNLTFKF
jgi:hypothetical protein